MNRIEFMKQLEILLQNLPEEERKDALQYYEGYFEDAGPDKEQEIIRELKSPQDVARIILEDAGQSMAGDAYDAQASYSEYQDGVYSQGTVENQTIYGNHRYGQTMYHNQGNGQNTYDNQGYDQNAYHNQGNGQNMYGNQTYGQNAYTNQDYNQYNSPQYAKKPMDNSTKTLMIVLLIVTAPVTIPIIISIIGMLIGIVGAIFGIVIGFFAGAMGLFIGGGTLISMGLTGLGFWVFGLGFLLISIAFLLLPFAGWICKTAIPEIIKAIKKCINKLTHKGGNMV